MMHLFEVEIAAEYGVNAAVLLQNMYYWIEKNRANDVNFYDGKYWTYNSVRAFRELFPYMSTKAINTALAKLLEAGILVSGNYNPSAYDRTLWYAITDYGYSILSNRKIHLPKTENEFSEMGQPIPDNKPDNKPDKNNTSPSGDVRPSDDGRGDEKAVIDAWNSLGLTTIRGVAPNSHRKQQLNGRLNQNGLAEILEAIENVRNSPFLNGQNKNGFTAKFDWFIKPSNFQKVLEGNYNDRDGVVNPANAFHKDSEAYQAACCLARYVEKNHPDMKPPDEAVKQQWAADIDKCNRSDGYDWDIIADVLRFSQRDPFWQKQILTGEKFREHLTSLIAAKTEE